MLTTAQILKDHGLRAFDVDELASHGGSLRVYACRAESQTHPIEPSVRKVIEEEEKAGLDTAEGYERFSEQVKQTKFALVDFLLKAAKEGKFGGRLWSTGQERNAAALLWHWKRSD